MNLVAELLAICSPFIKANKFTVSHDEGKCQLFSCLQLLGAWDYNNKYFNNNAI